MSHWTYYGQTLESPPTGAVGFVYLITNTVTDKKYIGRKYLSKRLTRKVRTKSTTAKKKLKSKVSISESNWKEYTGSSPSVNSDIIKYGMEKFTFQIISFGFTKGQVNYLEEYLQMVNSALLSPDYYNNSVGSRRYIALNNNERLLNLLANVRPTQ